MNEEEKKSAIKSNRLAAQFGDVMEFIKLTENEECSVVMNLLIGYLIKRKRDPTAFLKWISNALPVVVKNWDKTQFGHVSGDEGNTKIEMVDKPTNENRI